MTIIGDDEILATSMRNTCWAFAITTARGKTKPLLLPRVGLLKWLLNTFLLHCCNWIDNICVDNVTDSTKMPQECLSDQATLFIGIFSTTIVNLNKI